MSILRKFQRDFMRRSGEMVSGNKRGSANRRIVRSYTDTEAGRVFVLHATKGWRSYAD